MSMVHVCALGYFVPESITMAVIPRVERPLPREIVEPLRSMIVPTPGRERDVWWSDGVLFVEYIVFASRPDRRAFIREVVQATGCAVIDARPNGISLSWKPWTAEELER